MKQVRRLRGNTRVRSVCYNSQAPQPNWVKHSRKGGLYSQFHTSHNFAHHYEPLIKCQQTYTHRYISGAFTHCLFNPLNAELNPIRHLLALVGARHIVHVGRIRVNYFGNCKAHRTGHKYVASSLATRRPTFGTEMNAVSTLLPAVNQNLKLQTNFGAKILKIKQYENLFRGSAVTARWSTDKRGEARSQTHVRKYSVRTHQKQGTMNSL